MPHANDGSQHQYRPRSAGILFIPDELLPWKGDTSPESDALYEQLVKAMIEPIGPPRFPPHIIPCSFDRFVELIRLRRVTT